MHEADATRRQRRRRLVALARRGEIGGLAFLDRRADPIDFGPSRQRAADCPDDLVEALQRCGPGVDRARAGRLFGEPRNFETAVDGQHQAARDRRRALIKRVSAIAPLGGERQALLDAEAVLLVDDREGEVAELTSNPPPASADPPGMKLAFRPRSLRGADRRRGNLVVAVSAASRLLRCARNDNRRRPARSHSPVSLLTTASRRVLPLRAAAAKTPHKPRQMAAEAIAFGALRQHHARPREAAVGSGRREHGPSHNLSGNLSAHAAAPDREPLLAVAGVSKHFGGVRAVEDISLAVRRGALTSIIGPNGAGKTSLLNIISGF